ncbi:PKD domain-containing protein [Cryomorpha ignava]|uniref:PKD domain-containing protein n=1 Tax=Cryomorpha ignava TaxID=101383 RepID=A0A7K3WMJ3_9FLAO|nr:PKD domain-containing protein [Cryomorpha ignava]NEN22867.1 PKD domain-containing protein [Cryomorpha ignava]
MANQLDKFDELIKQSFDGFEVPYDPQHWDDLQANLDSTTPSLTSYFGAITTGLVATSVVFIAMLFFFSDAQIQNPKHINVDEITAEHLGEEGNENASQKSAIENNTAELSEESDSDATVSEDDNAIAETKAVNAKADKAISKEKTNYAKAEALKTPVKNIKGTAGAESVSRVRTGCTGLVINFDASEEYGSDAKYLWNFGDGFFSNESNPSHTFNKEGVFDVSLSVTSKTTGQISSNVVQAMIEVKEAPVANLDVNIESLSSISIKNDSYNASDLEWNVDGKMLIDKNEINISVVDNTRQNLVMSVSNDGGCTDTLETVINSVVAGSEFPRALGSSFGASFAPGAILDSGDVKSIKIFEKSSGKLVFEGSGNKGWNGTELNGEPAHKGAYKWLMAVKKSGSIDIYKGDIELR